MMHEVTRYTAYSERAVLVRYVHVWTSLASFGFFPIDFRDFTRSLGIVEKGVLINA